MKRRKKPEAKASVPPAPPAHEIALQALRSLRDKNYPASGRVKEYYIELSDIVRHYVERRFQMRAPEMTTEEFLSALKYSHALNAGQKGLMTDFLSHCDMVKFARYLPEEKEMEASFESAEKFIAETKVVPVMGVTHNAVS